jgi:manganese efflux pump family protein
VANHFQDAIETIMISLALGMDGFSLSIGIGLNGIVRRSAVQLCVFIGLFNVAFTLIGLYAGMMMEGLLGQVAQWFGAFVLIGLAIHMAYSTLSSKEKTTQSHTATTVTALLLFASGVSIDALSVGFSLGLRSMAYGLVSAGIFGFVSMLMCGMGLLIGKRATGFVGMFGELLSAIILFACGLNFLVD